ncbi:MAG TPA: IS200/IS605 family transposase [Ktedonobacterales bacterium]|nr:IS200/IS605 family transposase [Ktedonobacterales bacterium]
MELQDNTDEWLITYHFVWAPMRAKPCLTGEIAARLAALIAERASEVEFAPLTVLILPDRVYLAVGAAPTLAPHHIICQVKAYTSRILRDEFPELTRIPTLWTRAYVALAGDGITAEEAFRRFEATLQPRRPRGRPRKARSCDTAAANKAGSAANGNQIENGEQAPPALAIPDTQGA